MSNHSFTTTIEEADFEINYDYQPEEAMVMYYSDGSGYPGCPASVSINSVIWTTNGNDPNRNVDINVDVERLLKELGLFDTLEELCFEDANGNDPD